ncbi:hypothetical protein B0H19DRAFT_940234, partial [Mycena capillaripes]
LARKAASTISQLRTNFSPLNAYRFKVGFVDSPSCDVCRAAAETLAHYILECPTWEPLHEPLHGACREVGLFGPLHLSPLLSHPKLLKAFASFVEATGRFTWTYIVRSSFLPLPSQLLIVCSLSFFLSFSYVMVHTINTICPTIPSQPHRRYPQHTL